MKKYIYNLILMNIDILTLIGIFYLSLYIRMNVSGLLIPEFNELLLKEFSFVFFITFALMYYEKIYSNISSSDACIRLFSDKRSCFAQRYLR